jgi:LysR family transcriptional regulator, mexEF-oprN operon transcriptional activator
MSRLELAEVDLNLLKAFDALCREGSVTKAAERLALGQPAMSHALSRLRELLGDELFVKTPPGMEPTARARALMRPVRTALADLAHALNDGEAFDPMTEQWRARLGMPAFVAAAVLPAVSHTAHRSTSYCASWARAARFSPRRPTFCSSGTCCATFRQSRRFRRRSRNVAV